MTTKKYRLDKNIIYAELLRLLVCVVASVSLVLLATFADYGEEGLKVLQYVLAGVILLPFLIMVIKSICIYKTARFYIENDELCYEEKFIYKVNIKVPLSRISTVNVKRSLHHILTGCSLVQCSSGSVFTSGEKEFSVLLKTNNATKLAKILKDASYCAKEGQTGLTLDEMENADCSEFEKEKIKSMPMKVGQYISYGFLSYLFYLVLAISLAVGFSIIAEKFGITLTNGVILVASCIVGSFIISLVAGIIKYYNYRIYRDKDMIRISYGLLSQKNYSFPIYRVNAVKIFRHPLMMLFGRYSLLLQVIGYESDEQSRSIPYVGIFCTKKCLQEIIESFLPEFDMSFEKRSPLRKSILHFIVIPSFIAIIVIGFFLVIALIVTNAIVYLFVFAAAVLLILIDTFMQYSLTHAGSSDSLLCVKRGGICTTEVYVRYSGIQQVRFQRGFIRKKQKIGTYVISYYANTGYGYVALRNFGEDFMQNIQSKIDF